MKKYKIKVGISLRVENIEKYNEKRDAISQDWIKFCNRARFMPILIPNNLIDIKGFLKSINLDMLIFSGGDNIGDDLERDKTEKNMIEFAIENKIPSFGVCRGMQFFNKYFGGKIEHGLNKTHVRTRHKIKFTDKKMEKIFGRKSCLVNSFHENLVKSEILGKDLVSFGISNHDNSIEAFYHKKYPLIGVMWHPEREQNFEREFKLFKILESKRIWK
jgi:N5-(cytidine 5'-diphosphoramidyl)-L-glutamine hydrolase